MKKWSILIVAVVFIIVAFCLFFLINSYTNQFGKVYSKNIEDWSSFADYISGIGNTLISLASLIMIGFITILLGRDKNDYKYEQRNQAYDKLVSYIPKLRIATRMADQIMSDFTSQIQWFGEEINQIREDEEQLKTVNPQTIENRRNQFMLELSKEFNEQIIIFYDYHFFLNNFYPRYGHLFNKYVFGDDYHNLVVSAKRMADDWDEYRKILIRISNKKITEIQLQESSDSHFNNLTLFINELNKEI